MDSEKRYTNSCSHQRLQRFYPPPYILNGLERLVSDEKKKDEKTSKSEIISDAVKEYLEKRGYIKKRD